MAMSHPTRRALLALLAAGTAVALVGCSSGDGGWISFDPIRYRLTVTVETPQGLVTGSSVIQTVWAKDSGSTVTGEAVAVDLPGGQTLFVLLRSAANYDWPGGVPGVKWPDFPNPDIEEMRKAEGGRLSNRTFRADQRRQRAERVAWIRRNRDLHPVYSATSSPPAIDDMPYMVRFRDIRDPKSVEQVDANNLAASFGPGVRLISITSQYTEDPVTTGIERRLGQSFWSNWGLIHNAEVSKGGVNENPYFDTMMGRISRDDFEKGVSR